MYWYENDAICLFQTCETYSFHGYQICPQFKINSAWSVMLKYGIPESFLSIAWPWVDFRHLISLSLLLIEERMSIRPPWYRYIFVYTVHPHDTKKHREILTLSFEIIDSILQYLQRPGHKYVKFSKNLLSGIQSWIAQSESIRTLWCCNIIFIWVLFFN